MAIPAELQRQPAIAPVPTRSATATAFEDPSASFDPSTAFEPAARFPHQFEGLSTGPQDLDNDAEGDANSELEPAAPEPESSRDAESPSDDRLLRRPLGRRETSSGEGGDTGRRLERLDRDVEGEEPANGESPATPLNRHLLASGEPGSASPPGGSGTTTTTAPRTGSGESLGGVGSPMESSGEVRAATAEENREFVDIANEFIQRGGERYLPAVTGIDATTRQPILGTPPINRDQLIRQLDGWKATVEQCLRIIQESLGADAALDQTIRQTYRDAVDAAVTAAGKHQSLSRHQVYEEHHGRILEFAWPQATQDPNGNDLSDTLTAAERSSIRVVTTGISLTSIDTYFAANATPVVLPTGTTLRFGGAIPLTLRAGLQNIAGTLSGITDGLELNTTLTLGLDLGRVGGDYAAYRFTRVEHPAQAGQPATQEILVEHLGNIGLERMTTDQATEQRARFSRLSLSLGSGWGADPNWDTNLELQALLRGISAIPDADFTRIPGLKVDRASSSSIDASRAGEYNIATHTISLFDNAFHSSLTRFGTPGASFADTTSFTIRHEIGHALDQVSLRTAMASANTTANALNAQVARQSAEFGDLETSPGRFTIPPDRRAAWDALQADITTARTASTTAATGRDRARSLAGGRWELQPGTQNRTLVPGPVAAGSNAFRLAAQQDGVRITEYSDQSWLEYFAEAYALFRSAPGDLRRLRPHVYDYMLVTFP
jgi:hypothetical protein